MLSFSTKQKSYLWKPIWWICKAKVIYLIDIFCRITFTVYPEGERSQKYQVTAKEGANLLDTLNDMNIKDLSVFGICDKQLACHSCRVNVSKKHYSNFPPVSEDE